ncbi:MAG: carbonate dehydratase [Candidatus Kryptoniota bacterium]
MRTLNHLFEKNKRWAERLKANDPEFFTRLENQQSPEYLWIGCSDSRVPATEIVDILPGEIFVHRNIANLVLHTDFNCLSVIQFAVEVLNVKDIIVCGHYGCGGVKAAMDNTEYGLLDNWLRHIKELYIHHSIEMEALTDVGLRCNLLTELNVMEQVWSVSQTSFVQNAWKNRQELNVHGWIYDVSDGILKDLDITVASKEEAWEIRKRM